MNILAIGDVVGEQTLDFLRHELPKARQRYGADLIIANGENVCDVHGISPKCAEALFDAGVDFITSGNHIFDRRDAYQLLDDATRIIRPCNYPAECPGEGSKTITAANGWQILVVNVSGVAFMDALANPYTAVEHELAKHRGRYDVAVLDVHAEATSEKIALARYFDGKFAAIFGTHTHVQTNDAQILPNGTGYLTDLGMSGPLDGILGVTAEDVIYRARTHLPRRFTVAEGPIAAHGALFEINPSSGKCLAVKTVKF